MGDQLKDWVKSTIRTTGLGYLSIVSDETPQLVLFPYIYDKGHLRSSITVLRADILHAIERIPFVQVLITQNNIEIQISGRIHLVDNDLDHQLNFWQDNPVITESADDLLVLNRVPHLQKQVILDFIPEKIVGKRDDTTITYELEIL